jgi:hypothetical protein
MDKEPSEEQVKHNISLQRWYPLGQIDAIWHLVEHLHQETGFNEDVDNVLTALQKLDTRIRNARYPLPKRGVKGSNGILRRKKGKSR